MFFLSCAALYTVWTTHTRTHKPTESTEHLSSSKRTNRRQTTEPIKVSRKRFQTLFGRCCLWGDVADDADDNDDDDDDATISGKKTSFILASASATIDRTNRIIVITIITRVFIPSTQEDLISHPAHLDWP